MERVYWNDEWNQPPKSIIENTQLKAAQLAYNIMYDKINKMLEEELKKDI